MKFSCTTSEFLQALQLVGRAISNQQALPILGNILIEANGRRCTVSATDLEISIVTSFEAKIENEGSITIPAKAIVNFAQYNNDPEILLETHEGTTLRCTSKHAKTSIAGEAASEYPTITAVEKHTAFPLPSSPLLHALHLVTFATARTTLRPVLSGVYLHTSTNEIVLVATDSYRLSECRIPAKTGGADISCVIPAKILDELRVILGARKAGQKEKGKDKEKQDKETKRESDDEAVEMVLSKQQIELHIGHTRLISRLIDGKFPNYEQILPKDSATEVKFSVAELTTAVKRMHYFAKEVNNNLTFHCGKTQTRIITPETPAGRDEATLAAEGSGKDNKIALSSNYLLDFLGHLDAETIVMNMQDSTHPAVFTIPGEKHYLHLIMPLRMQEG